MKSIRTRLIGAFFGTILLVFFALASIGIYYLVTAIEVHSTQSMEVLNEEKTTELNNYFGDVEKAVNVLQEYLISNVTINKYKVGEAYRQRIYDELKDRARSTANIIDNVQAIYFRPDPELYGGTSGFFLSKSADGEFKNLTPTDILQYDENDLEHVGWYYEPLKTGAPTWMEPYSNENINVYMISYVTPVYLGNEFLGILGMDIDMTLVHQTIDKINYQGSTGALFSKGGALLYHINHPGGLDEEQFTEEISALSNFCTDEYLNTKQNYQYSVGTLKYRIMVNRLENGMIFTISTPESELFRLRNVMIIQLSAILLAALISMLFVSMRMTKKIVDPIQELTDVSSRIAKGELGQTIEYYSQDEIGSLADSIRKMSLELGKYIDYIHGQAYLDAMTGVRNKGAYLDEQTRQERLIRENMAEFTIYVFDVNGLKKMNDTRGHEYGDMMIKDAALNIRTIFGADKVYRVGGDEFVAFSDDDSEEEIFRQFARFDEQLRNFNNDNERYEEELAISKGAAVYSPRLDSEFADVFGRADEEMYKCKAEYYKT
nr:diguanylate cyclase [Butyrivibrio sp.]